MGQGCSFDLLSSSDCDPCYQNLGFLTAFRTHVPTTLEFSADLNLIVGIAQIVNSEGYRPVRRAFSCLHGSRRTLIFGSYSAQKAPEYQIQHSAEKGPTSL